MAFAPILTIATLFHLYIGWRLGSALSDFPWAVAALWAVLVLSVVSMPLAMASRRFEHRRLGDAVAWIGMPLMGFFSTLMVLTLLREVMLLVAAIGSAALAAHWPSSWTVAALSLPTAAAVPLLALLVTVWGFFNARRTARVVEVDVPIAGLPKGLHGFTIAQVSDVHVGPTIKRHYVSAIVDRVNRLNADMVALTGDLVDGSVAALRAHAEPLGTFKSRHGTFFVTGNHEYYSGASAWTQEFRRLGMRVLMNEHVVIEHGGATLVAGGVTDYNAGHFDMQTASDPVRAMAGAPAGAGLKLLLAHQPRSATAAAEAGFDLQLSGHTHGGQFWPWNLFVPMQQPYVHGLHRLGRLWIYTSRGTGYWGPPKRFGAPSEITLLRMVQAA